MLGIERHYGHPNITHLPEVVTSSQLIATSRIQAQQILEFFSENYRDFPLTPRSEAVVGDYLIILLVVTNRREANSLLTGSTIVPIQQHVQNLKDEMSEAVKTHEMVSEFGNQKPLDLDHAQAHRIIALTVAKTLQSCYGNPGELIQSAQNQLSNFIKRLREIEQEAQALQCTDPTSRVE